MNSALGFTSNAGWQLFDFTANLDTSKTLMGISTFGYTGGGTATEDRAFIDNVLIDAPVSTAVPKPSSLLLLTVGAAASALLRRKRS